MSPGQFCQKFYQNIFLDYQETKTNKRRFLDLNNSSHISGSVLEIYGFKRQILNIFIW